MFQVKGAVGALKLCIKLKVYVHRHIFPAAFKKNFLGSSRSHTVKLLLSS